MNAKNIFNIDVITVFNTYDVPFVTEGDKHSRPGWVQVHCPFCEGSQGYHLGYNTVKAYFHCWRCGWHPVLEALALLLHVTEHEANEVANKHRIDTLVAPSSHFSPLEALKTPEDLSEYLLPLSICPKLSNGHKHYLRERGFDPLELEKLYGLQSVGHLGPYKFRIFVPIIYEGRMVSYQTRAVLRTAPLKYKACAKKDEVIHHKHILYNADTAIGDTVIVVEGVTDVWKLGAGAVATFGTAWTTQQATLLGMRWKRRIILFDSEPAAQERAEALANTLSQFGGETEIATLNKTGIDPGGLSYEEAKKIKRNLLRRKGVNYA